MSRRRHSHAETTPRCARHARATRSAAADGRGRSTPAWLLVALVALGILWTLPNTLLGLLIGAAGWPFGARMRWQRRELALVVRDWPWGKGGAITLGNVIVHGGAQLDRPCQTYAQRAGRGVGPRISLAAHERAHVYQYLVFGPLFLPLYLLCGGVSADNRFERAADRYAQTGNGWFPWSRAAQA